MNSRSLKAAVALSNTSVTLLERACYRDAIVTLRDALYLTRAAFPGGDDFLPWKESAIQFSLHKASECLGRSVSKDERTYRAAFQVNVISDSQQCLSEVLVISNAEVFAVRIDDSRYDGDECSTMHFEAATILLNYGTACRCLQSSNHRQSTDLLVEGFNFLQMAYAILAREFTHAVDHASNNDVSRTVSLAMLVLDNMMQLCTQLEMPVELAKYCNIFARFSEISAELEFLPNWSSDHLAAAA